MAKKMKSKSVSRRRREIVTRENTAQVRMHIDLEQATRARIILEYIVMEQFAAGKSTLGGALQRVCDMLPREFRIGTRDARTGVCEGVDDIPF